MPSQHTPPQPLVTIAIPTYNRPGYLDEALRSARDQTHEHLEILVVDNASTDDTVDVARRHQAEDDRVVIFENPTNLGPIGNYRQCLARATGEYVKFLMSDDLLHVTCVERLVGALEAHPSAALATSHRGVIDGDGAPQPDIQATRPLFTADTVVDGRELGDLVFSERLNVIGEPTSVLFRRDAVADPEQAFTYRGGSYVILADVALWLTLLETGDGVYLADTLSSFRRHAGQYQRSVRIAIDGFREWRALAAAAQLHGFLTDPVLARRVRSSVLVYTALTVRNGVTTLWNERRRSRL